jgi:predicted DNA binding CopG/RHH family protein
MKTRPNLRAATIRLPEHLLTRARVFAVRRRIPFQELVARAISDYLARNKNTEEQEEEN